MPEHSSQPLSKGLTRIEAVMEEVRSRIASRAYPPGTRLPSVRAQAQATKLSVSTVLEAYERLAAEGMLTSRRGSGFYVAGTVAPLALACEARLQSVLTATERATLETILDKLTTAGVGMLLTGKDLGMKQ